MNGEVSSTTPLERLRAVRTYQQVALLDRRQELRLGIRWLGVYPVGLIALDLGLGGKTTHELVLGVRGAGANVPAAADAGSAALRREEVQGEVVALLRWRLRGTPE